MSDLLFLLVWQGFYEDEDCSKPVAGSGPLCLTGSFISASTLHVLTDGIAVIHLVLSGIDTTASPVKVVDMILRDYHPNGGTYYFAESFFCLDNEDGCNAHQATMKTIAACIRQ